MNKKINKKLEFTFFEVIAVITILVIVSSIIFTSINKKDNTEMALVSSMSNEINTMQTAVDKYFYDNNSILPAISSVTESTPSQLDFKKLYPKYIKNTPEDKEFNYWVDFMGKIWISSVKTPSNVIIDKTTGQVTWSAVSDAKSYVVYLITDKSSTGYILNSKTMKQIATTTQLSYKGNPNKNYLVSAVDKYGFPTAPVGSGYETTLNPTKIKNNSKPIAVITMTPNKEITTATTITWEYFNSTDVDNDKIITSEWRGKQDIYPIEGTYTVELRVQDEHGEWSEWVKTTFDVVLPNNPPTAIITMTPETNIDTETLISWDYTSSTDPNGDAIINAEWIGKQSTYPIEGTYTVELRVQDSKGLWSNWIPKTFTVSKTNHKPTAIITMIPETNLTTASNISFDYINSTDPDGDLITMAEWKNKFSTYPEGTYTVELRVQDERGLWSDWVSKTFTIGHYNEKPIAEITMHPDSLTTSIDTTTNISWDYRLSSDPNGDTIISAEWKGTQNIYSVEGIYTVQLRVQDEHGLWSDWITKTFTVVKANQKPTAVITMSPETNIDTTTLISWSSNVSSDIDGDAIINEEWIGKQSTYSVEGTYTVQLRVQDGKGLWSDWITKTFTVVKANQKPTAIITMSPETNIDTTTLINWSSNTSSDIDGDAIINEEWIGKQSTYSVEGTYTVQLRVQDEHGLWSNWITKTFTVVKSIQKPTAIITINPNPSTTTIYTTTTVNMTETNSIIPTGRTLISSEWRGKQTQYTVGGTYTIQLRVKDSSNVWSDWVSKEITVIDSTLYDTTINNPPIAVMNMTPDYKLTPNTTIQWSTLGSSDPDGDIIVNEEWIGKQNTYPEGTYTVKLRVQDSRGLWSDWLERTFSVSHLNNKPTAVISMTPDSPNTFEPITWGSSFSTDPDGDTIINEEWLYTESEYLDVGQKTVFLRVQDEHGLWSDWVEKSFYVLSNPDPTNSKPIAVATSIINGITTDFPNSITTTIDTNDYIIWRFENSYDLDGDKIIRAEWIGNQNTYTASGTYSVELRVMDEHGLWSDWKKYIFNISTAKGGNTSNTPPTAVITMTPDANVDTSVTRNTLITFSHTNSTDADGDTIINAEWINAVPKYEEGEHTVKLRVMDSRGLWSEWVEKTFIILNRKPIAIISMTPDTNITAKNNVSWDDVNSYDPDGDLIISTVWAGKMVKYPDSNTYKVKLKVQDQHGLWSDWACKKVIVGDGGSQIDKYSECDGTSNGTGTVTNPPPTDPPPTEPINAIWIDNGDGTFSATANYCPDTSLPCAVINVTHTGPYQFPDTNSIFTWNSNSSYASNKRITIVNSTWLGNQTKYPTEGTHEVKLQVQDSNGVLSQWTTISFGIGPAGGPAPITPLPF